MIGEEIGTLAQNLQVVFNDPRLLHRAFIHRSYLNEITEAHDLEDNERLEFVAAIACFALLEGAAKPGPAFCKCRCASYFSAVGFLFPDFALESQIAASFRKSRWVLPGRRV